MKLSTAQREVLEQAVENAGYIDRWSVDGNRLRTLKILVKQGLLGETAAGLGTRSLSITKAGREALK